MRWFYSLCLCLTFLTTVEAKTPVAVDVPLHHWSYPILERLSARGLVDIHHLSTRPLTRIQMADITIDVIESIRQYQVDGRPWTYTESLEADLDRLVDEFRSELVALGERTLEGKHVQGENRLHLAYPVRFERVFADLDDNDTSLMRNRNGWRLEEGGNVRLSTRMWGTYKNTVAFAAEPVYFHNREVDDLTAEEAYARVNVGNIELSVGRTTMWWGLGQNGSLILSSNSPPLDSLRVKNVHSVTLPGFLKHLGPTNYMYFMSRLKSSRDIQRAKLTGARVTVAPHSDFLLGLSKTVMMGGERSGRSLGVDDVFKGLFYSNHNEQGQANNNQMMMLDAVWRLRNTQKYLPFTNNIVLYGQVANDDEDHGDLSNFAYMGGAYLPDVFFKPGLSFRMEYATTKKEDDENAFYSHPLYTSGYTHKGHQMGHFMGGDAEGVFFRFEKSGFFKPEHTLGFQFNRVRSLISQPDTEIRTRLGLDFTMYKNAFVEARFGYILEHIDNYLHVDGSESTNHILEISGRAEF